jgi:NAD(P)-dependent dehydrogenase (short-subunit alcohol dehydrogenase family)
MALTEPDRPMYERLHWVAAGHARRQVNGADRISIPWCVAAKAGVHLLATAMALDLAPDGIRVCCVAACEDGEPTAEDAAASVAFCASDEASYVLGSTFFLDGPLPYRG